MTVKRAFMAAGLTIVSVVTLVTGGVAQAATSSTTSGDNALRISPVRSDYTIQPGSSQMITVTIENTSGAPSNLHGMFNDFTSSSDESGEPRLYLDENTYAPSRSLKRYAGKVSDVQLQPHQSKEVKVTISIPKDAPAGGYFGAIRFAPASATPTEGKQEVSLSASVASLVLVTVPGKLVEQVGVDSMNVTRGENGKASSLFLKGDSLQTVIRFKNTGNVQESPFGKVTLKKSGKTIGTYEVNNVSPRGSVLPDSVRRFTVKLNSDSTSSFGKYTLEGNFGYGDAGQLITATRTFWVVPMPYLITGIVLLLLVVAAIITFPRMLKAHDRKLLRRIRSRGKR